MQNISKKQALDRWGILPMTLREALFSEENSAVISGACEREHLSKDKSEKVGIMIGDVLFGFIHSEDLPKEIKSELGINQEIANAIYTEIDRKIFSSVRADLQKVYSPVTGAGFSPKAEAAVPSENVVNLKPAPAQAPSFETIPIVLVKEDTAKADKEKLAKLLAVGNTSGAGESVKDEPFMLHKVTEVKPDQSTPVDKRSRGGLFWFAGSGKLPEKETKAKIQIEEDKIGKSEYKTESKIVSTPQTPVRIVHYSQFKTPVSPFGEEQKPGAENGKPGIKQELPKPPVPKPFDATPSSVETTAGRQGKPEAPKGISMVGKAPQPISAVRPSLPPVTPLTPRIIKPEGSESSKSQIPNSKNVTIGGPKIIASESEKKSVWPEPVVLKKPETSPPAPAPAPLSKPEPKPAPASIPTLRQEPEAPLRDINITMNMGTPAPQPKKEEPKISYVASTSRAEPPPLRINEVPRESIPKTSGAKDQNININISVTPPAQGIPMVGKSVSQGTENRKQEPILLIPEVPEFKAKVAVSDMPPPPAKKIDDDVVDLRTFEIKRSAQKSESSGE